MFQYIGNIYLLQIKLNNYYIIKYIIFIFLKKACTSCVEFLEKTYRNMSKYLYKSTNFQSFIIELGIIFFE